MYGHDVSQFAMKLRGEDGGSAATSVEEVASRKMKALVTGNAVVVFTVSGCCMCHAVKRLLFGLGVSPLVVELGAEPIDSGILALLRRLSERSAVPAIFIGGEFFGGMEAVIIRHVGGALVPLLKDAGALWL